MPLSLQLSSIQACDCKTITLRDATGLYSAVNVGGWGSSNPGASTINCAYLSILLPGNIIPYYKDITSIFIAASGDLDLLEFPFTMSDCGGAITDSFPDGKMVIGYHVGTQSDDPSHGSCTNGTLASVNVNLPIYCTVQCCIISKIALIPQYYCCDSCKNSYVDYCFDLWMMLKALQTADISVSSVQFENILAQVQKLCANENCQCV